MKNIQEIQGQFVGLMKFQNDGLNNIKRFYEKTKKMSSSGPNPLNANIPFEKSFMTDFLQGLIHDDHKLNPVIIKNGWLEIDSLKDYELYNRMNSNGNLKKFINFEE